MSSAHQPHTEQQRNQHSPASEPSMVENLQFKEMEKKARKNINPFIWRGVQVIKPTVTCINSCAIEGEMSTAFE